MALGGTQTQRHRNFMFLETNGIRLRAVVEGYGPLVILVHGWPECWYSYRHQIDPLVAAGYRVAAIDVRGYGGSDKPDAIDAYSLRELATDVAGVIDALGEKDAILIGHDWGASVVWTAAVAFPEKVRAVVGMGVPWVGRLPRSLTEIYKAFYPDRYFYQLYFIEPGVAERELDRDIAQTLRRTYYGASGAPGLSERVFLSNKPRDAKYLDGTVDPQPLPAWLTEEDLAYYIEQFEQAGGFRSSLGRYRNHERDYEDSAALGDAVVTQPALFIAGAEDPVLHFLPGYNMTNGMEQFYAQLRGKLFIPGAGHWVQQEKPAEVNAALLSFLKAL